MSPDNAASLRLALPKGRMHENVVGLLESAGIRLSASERSYRPVVSHAGLEVKLLKPQNIIEMLHAGSRDAGFAGADWVAELGLEGELVEVLDTRMDAVRLVAAAPVELLEEGRLPRRPLVVASEYERLTRRWIAERRLEATFVRSFGATEVFPPEDADCIVDVVSTGATLAANRLVIVDELVLSSTRLYAHGAALKDARKRPAIQALVLLLQSVLEARRRVMIEVNVPASRLAAVVAAVPCMRQPTVSPLHGEGEDRWFAVKAAVPREQLPALIPLIKARGGSDIVVSGIAQIVP